MIQTRVKSNLVQNDDSCFFGTVNESDVSFSMEVPFKASGTPTHASRYLRIISLS
jgi:hypothetical protein